MIIRAGIEYYIESKKLSHYANDKNGNFSDVSRSFDMQGQEVYVIIIGEATSRLHLGIYDYYRNTTPLLEDMEDELLIYNKVISPDTYTIASLTKALTLGNYENPEAKFEGSIIQLLNKANFKTYWVSVQKPAGADDSQITNLGLGADKSYFLNIKRAEGKTIHDEVLVEKLDKILLEKGNKKVIFLHTLGTHVDYKNRYPESFKFFNNEIPKTKFKKEHIYKEINAYDNAVRYTDYIISSVIKTVKKANAHSCVLYFSDHGEEVYDDIEFSGHFRDKLRTKNVYEIPFILWRSENYKEGKTMFPHLDSKYMIDDLFHSMADLFSIKAKEVDYTRSIFSEHFKERKRIVGDSVDYDNYFK
ncbi:phosphoethanolamine transferase [uncultured Algibacter sp.]|uniref:phosphoethanolamine transferase n=1 Tax=uncultured Algibacter sp. TaxID=298659 RepID=UPI0030EC510F